MKANQQKVTTLARRMVIAICLVGVPAACGGVTSSPTVGSESHFLSYCDAACGGGLQCIAGICTRPCLTDVTSCSELGFGAACTNQSVEPGAVAVCDVSCSETSGCAALGQSYTCEAGFCRIGASANAVRGGTPESALPSAALPEPALQEPALQEPALQDTALQDAGVGCVGPTCSECPAPQFDLMSSSPRQWARQPQTGACCEYADMLDAPPGWPVFDSQSECETDCRCAALENYFEGEGYSVARTTLDCRCAGGQCPTTPEEAVTNLCTPGRSAYRREGCGMIAIAHNDPTFGEGWVFIDGAGTTPALVGAYSYSDARAYPCQTYSSIAGLELECEVVTECQLCGEAFDTPLPSCN